MPAVRGSAPSAQLVESAGTLQRQLVLSLDNARHALLPGHRVPWQALPQGYLPNFAASLHTPRSLPHWSVRVLTRREHFSLVHPETRSLPPTDWYPTSPHRAGPKQRYARSHECVGNFLVVSTWCTIPRSGRDGTDSSQGSDFQPLSYPFWFARQSRRYPGQ